MSPRWSVLGLLLATTQLSCVRWVQQPGDPALDSGVEAGVDRAADQTTAADSLDARRGGLNGPCNPGECEPGLVCTGVGTTWFCRPPCVYDAGVCPDGQLCGKPLGALNPTPRACLVPARKFESCAVMPCPKTMGCVSASTGRYCYPGCGATACAPGTEACEPIGTSIIGTTFSGCVPTCSAAATVCPTGQYCAGVDPQDLCLPVVPLALGQPCAPQPCASGLRCFGNVGGQHYCYPICTTTCTGGRTCVLSTTDHSLCFTPCDPFGTAGQCASYEVCLPSPAGGSGYCFPGPGQTGTCGALPCETGMICVQGTCRKLCAGAHPCASGTCTPLVGKDGGVTGWSACT